MKTAARNTEVLQMLKLHIGMGLEGERSEDNSIDLQVQIAEIDAEFRKMLDRVSTETVDAFDEETATQIVRQLLECMVVDSKERITVIFKGGIEVVQPLTE